MLSVDKTTEKFHCHETTADKRTDTIEEPEDSDFTINDKTLNIFVGISRNCFSLGVTKHVEYTLATSDTSLYLPYRYLTVSLPKQNILFLYTNNRLLFVNRRVILGIL